MARRAGPPNVGAQRCGSGLGVHERAVKSGQDAVL
jgi:hypothetical protein